MVSVSSLNAATSRRCWVLFKPRFQSAVITLDTIVGAVLGVVERIWDQFLDDGLEGLSEIGDHLVRFAMGKQRCADERSGHFSVASR